VSAIWLCCDVGSDSSRNARFQALDHLGTKNVTSQHNQIVLTKIGRAKQYANHCKCTGYCAISFNSAVTHHGASQNAEMSRLSRRFSWCAEFILTIMSLIYNFFRRLRRSNAEILGKSRQPWGVAETKISAGPSRVTGPAELIEMAQYTRGHYKRHAATCRSQVYSKIQNPRHLPEIS
jgi:hypothetical protein